MDRLEAETIAKAIAEAPGDTMTRIYVLEALSAAGFGWQFVSCYENDPDCLNGPKTAGEARPSHWMDRIPVAVRPTEVPLPF